MMPGTPLSDRPAAKAQRRCGPAAPRALQRADARRAGFTLVEVLAVITIIGILSGVMTTRVGSSFEKARVTAASTDMRTLLREITARDELPASLADIGRDVLLDPWGRPYQYVVFPVDAAGVPDASSGRTDRFGVVANSAFDLYSLGPDGATGSSFTSASGRDDIVVAADGAFVGSANTY